MFGVLGDRLGRVKTMTMTILAYSVFTVMNTFSTNMVDFNIYRFLCGFGVGGQFAVGVALVAEVVPARTRPYALGLVQATSAIGNMMAAVIGIVLGQLEISGGIQAGKAWRYEFLAGGIAAPLAIIVYKKLREPEAWLRARSEKKRMGSFVDLFSDLRWRRNAIVGMLLAFSGVVGLWGIGFFSYDLFRPVLERAFIAEGLTGAALKGKITTWIGLTSLFQNLGGFLGVYAFTHMTHYMGRKKAFAISFFGAMGMTAFTFWNLNQRSRYLLDGAVDGLRPACAVRRVRDLPAGTVPHPAAQHRHQLLLQRGTPGCRRGPLTLGLLTSRVYHGPNALRYAGVTMCLVFFVGLAALPFAPETKGQPLPE